MSQILLPKPAAFYKTKEQFILEYGENYREGHPEIFRYMDAHNYYGKKAVPHIAYRQTPFADEHQSFYITNRFVTTLNEVDFKVYAAKKRESNKLITITPLHKDSMDYRVNCMFRDTEIEFCLCYNPTGNCQVCSISYFNSLLDYSHCLNGAEGITKILSQALEETKINKTLLMFDVKQNYITKVKQFNPLFLTEYVSSNSSKMVMGILQIEKNINSDNTHYDFR